MRDDPFDLHSPTYTPARLLTKTAELLGVPNTAKLAQALEVDHAVLSRVHKRKAALTPHLMVRIMDRTGWHIQELRRLAGMPYEGPVVPPIQGTAP